MIKAKILVSISILSLSFLLLIFTALRISGNSSFSSEYAFSLATTQQKAIYEDNFCKHGEEASFVYPGILPNHPFYWLKMVRDRIKLQLTRDPVKRLGLYLLYSDKRLVSGTILILDDEVELGISTISKAEKYLRKAAIYGRDNIVETGNEDLFTNLVSKYFDHRQEIEFLLISDLAEDKKQVLHKLQEDNNSLFEDKYFDYVKRVENECTVAETDETEEVKE